MAIVKIEILGSNLKKKLEARGVNNVKHMIELIKDADFKKGYYHTLIWKSFLIDDIGIKDLEGGHKSLQ